MNQDKPKEERWLLSRHCSNKKKEREKEFNKSSSFFLCNAFVLSFLFSFLLKRLFICQQASLSFSSSIFLSLSLSRTICFSISAYTPVALLISYEDMQRWTKIVTPPLSSQQQHHIISSVCMRHICKKKKNRGRHKKNVKRELRVNVSAEYDLWINKQKKMKRERLNGDQ
jgi:hypothetical protein